MITVYPPNAADFGGNGLGILQPTACTVQEIAAGMYELSLEHPIDDTLRWAQLAVGCVLKAAVPVRETPLYESEAYTVAGAGKTTVTRSVYRVRTNGGRLRLRQKPSASAKILSLHRPGTEVVKLGDAGGNWYEVAIRNGGAKGYMYAGWLRFDRDVRETITRKRPVTRRAVTVAPSRDQLFRVVSVEPDTAAGIVSVRALHIFYDLRGNPLNAAYDKRRVPAATVVDYLSGHLLNPSDFTFWAPHVEKKITGDWSYKSAVEILLDPDEGVAALAGALVVRDNYDVYLIPDDEEARDMGVTVRRGKNLAGVTVTTDAADLVTRIIPVGRKANGDPLYLSGTKYVDSPRAGDYPVVYARKMDFDVRVARQNKDGGYSPEVDGESVFATEAQARTRLSALARAEFKKGVDLPGYGMEVDFLLLENAAPSPAAAAYENYAALQSVHLYDTVTVIDELIGLRARVRVTGYTWNVLTQQYDSVTLGEIKSLRQTVYSYSLPTGGVSGIKIAENSMPGGAVRSLSVEYGKFTQAAVERLMADSLTAMTAHVRQLVAGEIEADQLYADLARIAAAQITTANIRQAEIDWAAVETLTADILRAVTAEINGLTAQTVETNTLAAAFAHLFEVVAEQIRAGSVTADTLSAVMASLVSASVGTLDVGYAHIKDLDADEAIITDGVAGALLIERLVATSAMMASATLGELVVRGEDGKYYEVAIQAGGTIGTREVTVSEGEIAAGQTAAGRKIVETEADIQSLNATDVRAQSAVIASIFASALTAGRITAGQALISSLTAPELYVTAIKALGDTIDISANRSISLAVGEVLRRYIYVDAEGLHVTQRDDSGARRTGEVLIDERAVNVVVNGLKYSRFAANYVQFGNYQLRRSVDGGLAFKLEE